ncbi:UDP-N-acetylglucosamine 2-epimerase [Polynucleobacter duraquae]|uniref:UDP-N-acetylglucosamine 2-epimerase n=1 Tax=Polynucleobacter duraquae TaxID=1835254 RepID=A0A0E3ZL25_9BURK|nr:UDP-N-acetylglucosamine 2-epimerase (non-hydrolyzing) [Polynucleobacter duraquae]AKD24665.1 UDP-N-acetylglucosamine 2-epimerase [Polynucleobacter duraquae]
MTKIMTILGTRPEIIKMSRVISLMDESINHVLVHTGQNYDYELNEVFFKDLSIRKPDYFLSASGETAASTIGQVIIKSDEVLRKEMPDAVLLYGDTNSCLSVISAKRLKIPVFHMEAGNRSFDQRVPEELNRKVLDHLSDINLTLTEHARRYLIREGIAPDRIFKTGSHMKEVFNHYMPKILSSNILSELKIEKKGYFLVSLHREDNVDDEKNLLQILQSLNLIAKEYNLPIIISTHPRTRKRIELLSSYVKSDLIILSKPFGFFDYNKLQIESLCVISDSGTITEEASILGLCAITIRKSHERPEGMDFGTLIMSSFDHRSLFENIRISINRWESCKNSFLKVDDYEAPNVSHKILNIVLSYINQINDLVWHKNI